VKYRWLTWCDLLHGKTTRDTCQTGIENIRKKPLLFNANLQAVKYRSADNSLAQPTSRCILFHGENISFDDSLV